MKTMKLERGTKLMMQQFKALGKKNMRLTKRKKGALFLRFFASFFFVFMMWVTSKMSQTRALSSDKYREVRDPSPQYLSSIFPCEHFTVRRPCYDFVWSGDPASPRFLRIVDGIMANNPGRTIPSTKVKSFKTPEETNAWFLDNPARCPGALHLGEKNETIISYGTQTNSSLKTKVAKEDISSLFHFPLQVAAEREIARTLTRNQNLSWTVGWKEFAHPATPYSDETLFSQMGSTCLSMITLIAFQSQLFNLVMEKELHLREAMNIMGLYDSAYWLSWLTWEIVMTFFTALSTILFGVMFQFKFFARNNFILLFLVLYLYLLSMTSVAFVASAFVKRAGSASQVTSCILFLILGVQVVGQALGEKAKIYNIISKLVPPTAYNSAIQMLTDATQDSSQPGISWKGRNQCPPQSIRKCTYTMDGVFIQLLGDFFLWFLLALYFDNIIPSVNGIPKPLLYFLNPGYWTGRGGSQAPGGGIFGSTCWNPQPENMTPDDEDVVEEENRIKQLDSGSLDPDVAVQIRGLVKTYLGNNFKRSSPFHAIKGLWVNFPKDQLFCLLGHNGAGKSTTISCLTGITSVSGGDALVYEHSIRSSVGMSNIRKIIGVCPQFDILWNLLTGEEHLELFSSIKGLPSDSIPTIIHKLLEDVRLTNSAKVRAGSYSGGMRRRLSVAAALIGDPKLVILDEPTTGMDPITRRHVWDIIENAKKGRAIVLTTHSMEEADVLGDRIAIMAKGRLRCIGTSLRLKMRFGTGFVANLSFGNNVVEATNARSQEALKQFFKRQLDVVPTEENTKFLTFVIPHDKEQLLKRTFGEVQERQSEFGITDIQLGLATLEEVFLNVTRQEDMEKTTEEGKSAT